MAFNKKFFTTGGIVASTPAAAFDPLQNFEIVTYTGNGGTQKITGYIRKGAAFNGSSSFIDTNFTLPADSTMSFSFWINVASIGSTDEYIMSDLSTTAVDRRLDFRFRGSTGGQLYIDVGNGSSDFGTGNTSFVPTLNTWHHIVVTLNGTAINVYVDNGSPISLTSSVAFGTAGSRSLTLGRAGDYTTASTHLDGKIDQFRIFNKTLSSDDVQTLNNETYDSSTKSTTDIFGDSSGVALYELDENANDTGSTYNGTPTDIDFLGMAFQPDLVWAKARNNIHPHILFDSVRGVNRQISSDDTTDEVVRASDAYLFDSNGFTVTTAGNSNNNNFTYVAWCWKAGGTAVSNSNGTITSTVSANQAAGFSIVKYTGNTTAGATIGHGLSAAPELILIKNIDDSENWSVFGAGSASDNLGSTKATDLNQNLIFSTSADFNNTDPTASVFSVGTSNRVNTADNFIAYCFHSVTGYQSIGSYTGVSGDIVVETGFRPRFIMIKNTSGTGNWEVHDSVRYSTINTANGLSKRLRWNDDSAEAPFTNTPVFFRDTGFTLDSSVSGNTYVDYDKNGDTFIYLAIA